MKVRSHRIRFFDTLASYRGTLLISDKRHWLQCNEPTSITPLILDGALTYFPSALSTSLSFNHLLNQMGNSGSVNNEKKKESGDGPVGFSRRYLRRGNVTISDSNRPQLIKNVG